MTINQSIVIFTIMLLIAGLAICVVLHSPKAEDLEAWSPLLAEKQYEGAKHGRWGERIITLEESACELHRVRYRDIYYIANTCGGLVIEPTKIR